MPVDLQEIIDDYDDEMDIEEEEDRDESAIEKYELWDEALRAYGGKGIKRAVRDGLTVIPESEFENYARDYAEDAIGVDTNSWPCTCIDWEQAADELRADYTTLEVDDETYYYVA